MAFKTLLASTPVSIHQIVASSSILARVRQTFVFVYLTVDTNPACITKALISAEASGAVAMNAGVAQTLVHL